MKKLVKLTLIALLFISGNSLLSAHNHSTSKEFKVKGNCGMCETRIEKAAKSVEGVSFADWDTKTKIIKVEFDETKTDVHKIHMAIAKVGHDTEMHKAKDEVYNKLHSCCKYDRD